MPRTSARSVGHEGNATGSHSLVGYESASLAHCREDKYIGRAHDGANISYEALLTDARMAEQRCEGTTVAGHNTAAYKESSALRDSRIQPCPKSKMQSLPRLAPSRKEGGEWPLRASIRWAWLWKGYGVESVLMWNQLIFRIAADGEGAADIFRGDQEEVSSLEFSIFLSQSAIRIVMGICSGKPHAHRPGFCASILKSGGGVGVGDFPE